MANQSSSIPPKSPLNFAHTRLSDGGREALARLKERERVTDTVTLVSDTEIAPVFGNPENSPTRMVPCNLLHSIWLHGLGGF